jgi:hypothetical protein
VLSHGDNPVMEFTFDAALWEWEGNGSWHFVSLPFDVADEIEDAHGGGPGFGAVPVDVTVGGTSWQTSIFPDGKRGTFLLPVKKLVRTREDLADGDTVHIHLAIRT